MTQAYIIEIESLTAGIVARDERGYRFFSSDRTFDGLEGREFRSARDAERAARMLLQQRRHLLANPSSPRRSDLTEARQPAGKARAPSKNFER